MISAWIKGEGLMVCFGTGGAGNTKYFFAGFSYQIACRALMGEEPERYRFYKVAIHCRNYWVAGKIDITILRHHFISMR
ncbi:hypothetical protein DIZ81_13820 [Legionella taurinensis]|uniref:Uncharacterized protein n=1 Tax=Legionella taurinensis TaxID=70611 RepID=A0AB38N250_9GAMM|nr:hypothetical protein [Legionella taurinensis]MDX1838835.1 hypothetical protein [Legionella taurinensis]PUT38571.1 hypothetical protein DB744_13830 [Legionella taurinensis]PUT39348.1 hypothetical protein DB746_13870 [Legionella taurinensis]PUT41620.1 hypothetical protein DB743_13795 [Legionella taurinensis]PUT44643.1 hypothetical protein DB745_13780 [Legionella taurinensis]